MKCYSCKFHDTYYEFDGEDEYEIGICEAGHNEYLDSDEECPYYKRYRQRKYVDEDTECDKCECLSECMKESEVLECTSMYDERQHVVCGKNNCRKLVNI